jgi:hypothetical protein
MEVRRIKEDELYHHGIKGQRWGIRRYQNPDGSYTSDGKQRYGLIKKITKKERQKQKVVNKKVHEETENLSYKQIKTRGNLMLAGILATGAISIAAIHNSDKIVKAGNKAYNTLKDNYGNKRVTAMVDGKKVKGIVENAPGLSTKVVRSAKNQDTIDQYKALGVAAGALAGQVAISNKLSRRGQAYARELTARKKKKAKQTGGTP